MSCSSSGLGHRPFTAKITGSNPVHDTFSNHAEVVESGRHASLRS